MNIRKQELSNCIALIISNYCRICYKPQGGCWCLMNILHRYYDPLSHCPGCSKIHSCLVIIFGHYCPTIPLAILTTGRHHYRFNPISHSATKEFLTVKRSKNVTSIGKHSSLTNKSGEISSSYIKETE